MSQFDKPFLRLSPRVTIKKMPPGRVDDGITIPEPRVKPVDAETAKKRIRMFLESCALQGRVSENVRFH